MTASAKTFDVIILGAGAAGMMCAIEAGRRGRSVLLLDHAAAPGEKIRISGGGRCNFTNLEADRPDRFLSRNPRFALSALSRYRPADFIKLVDSHSIAWREKTLGQLFCEGSARQIITMLVEEMSLAGVELRLSSEIDRVEREGEGFVVAVGGERIGCDSLVLATGGKSIPKMGATGLAYDIARQFGLEVTETRPALVPLTFAVQVLERLKDLSGVSIEQAIVGCGRQRFQEDLLFTHRGLSGPSILQISSYWREGDELVLDLLPGVDVFEMLRKARTEQPRRHLQTVLGWKLPVRLAQLVADEQEASAANMADLPDRTLRAAAEAVNGWRIKPVGSEGYRTAEVTLGGVDTAGLNQKTMAARAVPGLFVIGEAVDVTGWLGGYNFQWAWASGWAAGQAV